MLKLKKIPASILCLLAGVLFCSIQASAESRVSRTQAVFARDHSLGSAFGEAFRDPSGMIWSSPAMRAGQHALMSYADAAKFCEARNARLPSLADFKRLARLLGSATENGYSVSTYDGRNDVLPGLSDGVFWSSTVKPDSAGVALLGYGFNGMHGDVSEYLTRYTALDVRCVSKR